MAEEVKGRTSSVHRIKKRDAASLVASLLAENGSGSAQSRPTVTACNSTRPTTSSAIPTTTATGPSPGPTTSALGSASDMVVSDACDVSKSIPSPVYIKSVKLGGPHPISKGGGGEYLKQHNQAKII